MSALSVSILGGPAPYCEALARKLKTAELAVSEGDRGNVLVIFCDSERTWDHATDSALWTPTVAVLPDLDVDQFAKALALGAGAVHLDTPTDVMVEVIKAAIDGEALLPLAITQALASKHLPGGAPPTGAIEGVEAQIADGLLAARTNSQIAGDLNYSDRTIRRKLQGLYLKLGVSSRADAIEQLRGRNGLIQDTDATSD